MCAALPGTAVPCRGNCSCSSCLREIPNMGNFSPIDLQLAPLGRASRWEESGELRQKWWCHSRDCAPSPGKLALHSQLPLPFRQCRIPVFSLNCSTPFFCPFSLPPFLALTAAWLGWDDKSSCSICWELIRQELIRLMCCSCWTGE